MLGIINPVDHAIGATTGAESIVERWTEPSTDALRIVEQRPHDQLVRGKCDGLRQVLGELQPSCG